jgi:hypothetical protein
MRCYFMKDGHIVGVAYLVKTDDAELVAEARQLAGATLLLGAQWSEGTQ